MPVYVRGTALKNRLDALFKLIMGKIYDTNAPGYRRNDRNKRFSQTSDTAFFLNASGKRLSARAIDLVIRRIGVDARLELSAHVLRHTCLTNLVRGGNDLVLVAEIAGHKRLETTRRYSLPSIEDRERAMEELRVDY